MPRPNRARLVQAEDVLAERVATLRTERDWSYEGLAKRMTDAGCTIQPSALFKIEKGEPRRRITVDELYGFVRVFGTTVDDLMASTELRAQQQFLQDMSDGPGAWRRAFQMRADYDRLVGRVATAAHSSEPIREAFSVAASEMLESTPDPDDSVAVTFHRDVSAALARLDKKKGRTR